jgi:hypothetical protein
VSADRESWQEMDRNEVNGRSFMSMWAVVDDREISFIWLVKTGRDQGDNNVIYVSMWRIVRLLNV